MFSADALTHASVFCRGKARTFMLFPMMCLSQSSRTNGQDSALPGTRLADQLPEVALIM
jgi:hypothetical protein